MRYVARAFSVLVAPGAGVYGVSEMMRWAFRQFAILIGASLVLISIPVALVTPVLPVGLPLAIVGLIILVNASERARRMFLRWAKRYPITSRPLRTIMRRRQKRS